MKNDIGEILITEAEIRQKVNELAQKLTVDYAHKNLTLIGVLNGSLVFLSDLIRQISFPVKIDTLRARAYVGASTFPEAEIDLLNNISIDLKDENVLILDDILDTGKTLSKIVRLVKKYDPLSLRVCVFLKKAVRRDLEIVPDYYCFDIEDKFVVGYGLDFNDKYRNLPYVAVLGDGS